MLLGKFRLMHIPLSIIRMVFSLETKKKKKHVSILVQTDFSYAYFNKVACIAATPVLPIASILPDVA